MKRQITQFDTGRSNATVATPTCSSCCCCCCCLTTALSSSTILARRIKKEAIEKRVSHPGRLTLLAALYLPIIGVIILFLNNLISGLGSSCTPQTYQSVYTAYSTSTVCSSPGSGMLLLLVAIVPVAVLAYLYARVKMGRPILRAILVTIIIWIAAAAEGFGGAYMITSGMGVLYLLLIPFLFIAVQAFYNQVVMHLPAAKKNPSSTDGWRT